jgi:hypothetical protein
MPRGRAATDRFPSHDRVGFASEDEKSRLKHILRVLHVVQDPVANTQHHRTVASHQRGESGLVVPGDELRQ